MTGETLNYYWNYLEERVEFSILGPLRVRDQDRWIEVSSAKERLLLAVLVLHANEVVSAERLIEVLWGTEPPATAANTLHTYVSHLRRALEPGRTPRNQDGVLRTRGQGYVLTVESEAIDAVRFERLAQDGRRALPTDPERAAETLRAALELWRGEPLAEFSFELFAQGEITRLTELHAVTLEDRVEADLALGRHAELCGELGQAVTERPLRERSWSQLIRALYRCGRQADALATYGRLREQLAERLGIEPSPELARLHEAVLTQRPDLGWQSPQPQPQSAPGPTRPEPVPAPEDRLPTARAALAAHDWEQAFELLSGADRLAPLAPVDLDGLAEAACWLGRYRESLSARQRAHHAFLHAGDRRRAAVAAVMLAMHHGGLRQFAVANGWFHRAQRVLEAEDKADCAEHGYLSWAATLVALGTGDDEGALTAAQSTHDIGIRHGVAELEAIGLAFQGTVLIRRTQVAEGLALLDEGMAMAVGGTLSPVATTQIFCQIIRTCYELGDYRRAQEWTEAIEDCFARTALTSFPGDTETHRIGIMIGRGAWELAEQEARRACARTQNYDLAHAGLAFASIGEIRLRLGDLAIAAEAFAKAEELGASALPGQARLELLRGRPQVAAALINAALVDESWDRLTRARLLPHQVTIALAVGDLDTARVATTELASSAETYGTKALMAAAEYARGELSLATGEDDASRSLRRSVALWGEADSPYESARARVLLATALERAGRPEAARLERALARECFERLGAKLDADITDQGAIVG